QLHLISSIGREREIVTLAVKRENPPVDFGADLTIALDLSLPLGNWFSAGMTHQNGYTMANLSARKQF
ncbi:hypothetical protein, partial [Escherichia coli]|uniref:hypothetical protein n=1 Tax=Escherichia coli TaxID=562 RepID=UPI003EDF4289